MRKTMEALVVVAHPDDETLWAGGTIMRQPGWAWTILSLCRGADPDRAPKFARVLERLGATGAMSDLDDGPDQEPLPDDLVRNAVVDLMPSRSWDIVFTHSPFGEYTRHRRHEEIGAAVAALRGEGVVNTPELRLFAYEDGGRAYHPRAIDRAHVVTRLDDATFDAKRRLIVEGYGFAPDSWEALATPRTEAFWRFRTPSEYQDWFAAERTAAGRNE